MTKPPFRSRALITLALIVGVTLLVQTGFRVAYYGDPLPNTYYLKMTGYDPSARIARGLRVFWHCFQRNLWPLYLLTVLAAINRAIPGRSLVLVLAMIGAIQSAYSIYVGGDAWEEFGFSNRYLSLMLPGLALFYGGMGRSKNVLSTMMHSFVVMGLIAVQWLVVGYTIGFGADVGGFSIKRR